MEHVNGWCFRGIYKGGLWENDLHVSAQQLKLGIHMHVCICVCGYGKYREGVLIYGCVCGYA